MNPTQSDARWNYRAFLVDGGSFACGVGFVNPQTLLPGVILDLGGPSWLAAFVPSAMVLGIFSVPVFTAPWVDRMSRVKPFVLTTGVPQRLVFAVAAALLLLPGLAGAATPFVLALTPFASGLCAGISISAFQRLLIRGLPARMRASNFSFRFMIGGLGGMLAGKLVERILESYPINTALSLLHFVAFGFMVVSWLAVASVREVPESAPEPPRPRSFRDLFDGLKDFLVPGPSRRGHAAFLGALVLMHAFFIPAPFFAAHLQAVTGERISFLGVLSIWFMGGSALGNLVAARVGDRFGGRLLMRTGLLVLTVDTLLAPFVTARAWVGVLYASFGFGLMLTVVGKETLQFDLSPERRQARYLAMTSLITMLAILGGSLSSVLIREMTDAFAPLAWTCAALTLAAFFLLSRLGEPRPDVEGNPLARLRPGRIRFFGR